MKILKMKVNEAESTDNKLVMETTIAVEKPLEYVTAEIKKPEGMSDEQFDEFVKLLQKEIENYDVHEKN